LTNGQVCCIIGNMEKSINITVNEIAKIFTEWDTRYRNHPEWFSSLEEHLLKSNPTTYGDRCAPYFIELFKELTNG
jgi:hypothetical protein